MSKYNALKEFLLKQDISEIPMKFDEIERLIGSKLPKSARTHRAWWSNNPSNSVITKEWLEAGFKSERVDMAAERLVFRRVGKRSATSGSKSYGRPTQSEFSESAAEISWGTTDHPLYGALKGTVRIMPGTDLTEPADPN